MALKELDLSEALESIGDCIAQMDGDTVVFKSDGKAVAALVPFSDLDLENARLARSSKFRRIWEEAGKGEPVSEAEALQRLGLTE